MDYENVLLYVLASIRRSFKEFLHFYIVIVRNKFIFIILLITNQFQTNMTEMFWGYESFIFIFIENVSLGNACVLNAQCLGSPKASCLAGKCNCIEGYEPDNSSKCIQRMNLACL